LKCWAQHSQHRRKFVTHDGLEAVEMVKVKVNGVILIGISEKALIS